MAPVGPAVANAIFAATGKRMHVLPFPNDGVARSYAHECDAPKRPGRFCGCSRRSSVVAGASSSAYIVFGPRPTDFAGGKRVALAAYTRADPTGVPAELKSASVVERGEYLTRAADCVVCHTAKDGAPFAGGRAFVLPFGTIYSTNITPDPDTGIGGYSDANFLDAMHKGIGRGDTRLYPAMPYASYTYMSDADALAIKAYLFYAASPYTRPRRRTHWFSLQSTRL